MKVECRLRDSFGATITMGEKKEKPDEDELMYVKCAACGKWMDVKPGAINRVSHTLCPDCFEQEMAKLDAEQRRS